MYCHVSHFVHRRRFKASGGGGGVCCFNNELADACEFVFGGAREVVGNGVGNGCSRIPDSAGRGIEERVVAEGETVAALVVVEKGNES